MRYAGSLIFGLLFAGGVPASVFGSDEAAAQEPTPVALERYEELILHSPFALATAPVAAPPPVEEAPSFARDFYVVGMAQVGEKPFVTLSSRDRQRHFSLFVGETSPDGITLSSVEWLPDVGKSRVTIKQGTAFGVVSFDEAAMKAVAPAAAPAASPVQAAYLQGTGTAVARNNNNNNNRENWRSRWRGRGGDSNDPARAEQMRRWRERQRTIGSGNQ